MSNILLVIQHVDGKILKGTLCALTAARELRGPWNASQVVGSARGPGAQAAAKEMLGYGLSHVRYSEAPLFEKYRAEPYARAIALAAKELTATSVVGLASSSGKDVLPRVAVLVDAAQASDIIGVNPDGSIRRPMYAGNIIAEVELLAHSKVVTVRSTAFAAASQEAGGSDCAELNLAGGLLLQDLCRPRFQITVVHFGQVDLEQRKRVGGCRQGRHEGRPARAARQRAEATAAQT